MSYPDVKIHNSTPFHATGKVEYDGFFCSDDNYSVKSGGDWAHSRGVCLITKITATIDTPIGRVNATSYDSSGTSYSNFAIIRIGDQYQFQVTRIVDGSLDQRPADYAEPTAQQK